jgi:hypothetical protein
MKKISVVLMAIALSATILMQTGCYGSFGLTKKVYEFNGSVGDKFLNTIVFWAFCIIPVYQVAGFLDVVIFNLLEFWTGSNPIAMNEGDIDIQKLTSGDKEYLVTTTRNNIHIEQTTGPMKGKSVDIIFRPEFNSCYLGYQGTITKFAEYDPSDLSTLKVFLPDGQMLTVDPAMRDLNMVRAMLQDKAVLLANE